MALKLYPIGIQTFEEIINRNLLYPKIRRIKKMSSLPKFWLQNTKMVRNTL